jgi:Dipeptidyl aminopeptidases/acylaminoacyl-peptidases
MARIECHYFYHEAFIEEAQILHNAAVIEHIPTTIIHGRYDMVCPVNQAFDLAERLPNAKLVICHHAGHSAFEREICEALLQATDDFVNLRGAW